MKMPIYAWTENMEKFLKGLIMPKPMSYNTCYVKKAHLGKVLLSDGIKQSSPSIISVSG